MVPSAGLEPATYGLEDRCSFQLSYEGKSLGSEIRTHEFSTSQMWRGTKLPNTQMVNLTIVVAQRPILRKDFILTSSTYI